MVHSKLKNAKNVVSVKLKCATYMPGAYMRTIPSEFVFIE